MNLLDDIDQEDQRFVTNGCSDTWSCHSQDSDSDHPKDITIGETRVKSAYEDELFNVNIDKIPLRFKRNTVNSGEQDASGSGDVDCICYSNETQVKSAVDDLPFQLNHGSFDRKHQKGIPNVNTNIITPQFKSNTSKNGDEHAGQKISTD